MYVCIHACTYVCMHMFTHTNLQAVMRSTRCLSCDESLCTTIDLKIERFLLFSTFFDTEGPDGVVYGNVFYFDQTLINNFKCGVNKKYLMFLHKCLPADDSLQSQHLGLTLLLIM
jgi:hypothetical protein